ncbi:MAG: J domain-containing protein [Raineya sp.]|nr:J domain-containing protein [Raineya sp.]MDW8296424.1 J domain-containing protein [Raineya sp.]
MFSERFWDILRAYINDAIDQALEERGLGKKGNTREKTYQQKTAFEEFEETYRKYQKYQQQYQSYQQKQQQYQKTSNYQTQNIQELRYYAWLEVPAGSSFEEIKKSYKNLMKKYHPDNFHHNESKRKTAEELCQKLNEAYQYFEKKFGKK